MSDATRGETDLSRLLASLQPVLDPLPYAFCHLPDRLLPDGLRPLGLFHEAEGLTIVVAAAAAEAARLPITFRGRRIILTVHSDFEAVGMMAAVARALADHGIPCNVIAAVFHDHLFVPEAKADIALAAVQALQAQHRNPFRLAWLADHPAHVDTLAGWHAAEWREMLPGWGYDDAREEFASHQQRSALPTTVIALAGDTLIGSASLVLHDVPGTEAWSPWLASVFVTPEWRSRGVGWRLVERIMTEARVIGVPVLHLFTNSAEGWYARGGWRVVHRLPHEGRTATIMAFDLSDQRGTFQDSQRTGPAREGAMTDWSERWQAILGDLERQRDELKVRLHLTKAEGREEWAKLEEKLAALRLKAHSAGSEAKDAMKDIGDAAEQLASEIRQGLERVRKTL